MFESRPGRLPLPSRQAVRAVRGHMRRVHGARAARADGAQLGGRRARGAAARASVCSHVRMLPARALRCHVSYTVLFHHVMMIRPRAQRSSAGHVALGRPTPARRAPRPADATSPQQYLLCMLLLSMSRESALPTVRYRAEVPYRTVSCPSEVCRKIEMTNAC